MAVGLNIKSKIKACQEIGLDEGQLEDINENSTPVAPNTM